MKLKAREGKLSLFEPLGDFYRSEVERQYREGAVPGMTREPEVPKALLQEAAAFTDTAVVTICRFSGEGWDRKAVLDEKVYKLSEHEKRQIELNQQLFEDGDFCLTGAEKALLKAVKEKFARIIIVMNVGGMVDTSWFKDDPAIDSVLMAWQGGMEGGLAAADLLCGDVNPSGKLADTFAVSLEAYPSTDTFHAFTDHVDYTEGIYVGYRYFESDPKARELVNYPFGFGLSYTDFEISPLTCTTDDTAAQLTVLVENTGSCPGKEVVQVYVAAPGGRLGKPAKVLAAFEKTRLLQPGEAQKLKFTIPLRELASYDEEGLISEAAYVLEAGLYRFYVGNSVEAVVEAGSFELGSDQITEQLSHKCLPGKEEEPGLDRMSGSIMGAVIPQTRYIPMKILRECEDTPLIRLRAVAKGEASLETFMEQLTLEDEIALLGGQPNTGVANTFGMGNLPEYGVPNMMTADGPAGLRIQPECGVCTTAWPCATLLSCSWNTTLVEEVGRAGAEEVKENGIGLWLTPGLNIHRSPLCGRNFEYYSEDPHLAGKMGAAMVRGIQSMHVGACPKHFACNNKETNRKGSDSRVSERALREIYLKPFEITVKEADPYAIMTSYNLINGIQASENKDLLTGILRGEWHFNGIVTTDWWTNGEHYREIKAGNDVKMASGFPDRVRQAYDEGLITREEIQACAGRVLALLLKLD